MPLPPPLPPLPPGEVHLWRLNLAAAASATALATLAQDEIARAERFVFARDRQRFMRGRSLLRELLAGYLGIAPAALVFGMNANGKPLLAPDVQLSFNLSHSGDQGLLAVSRAAAVGVDIEELAGRQTPQELRELAATVFSPEELVSIATLPDAAVALPFFTCWTRKEACLKALGTGLTLEPRTVHVGCGSERRRVPFSGYPGCDVVEVDCVAIGDDCAAAVAVGGGFTRTRLCHLDGSTLPHPF